MASITVHLNNGASLVWYSGDSSADNALGALKSELKSNGSLRITPDEDSTTRYYVPEAAIAYIEAS